jgi:hypothetical protein
LVSTSESGPASIRVRGQRAGTRRTIRPHVNRAPEILDREPVRGHCSIAAQHGFNIVRTYADNGKSGLRIEGRAALRQLIADVESGCAGFQAIFVYDVSRWGRFQDADVAAVTCMCRAGARMYGAGFCVLPVNRSRRVTRPAPARRPVDGEVITSHRDDLHAERPAQHDDLGAAFADPCAVLAVVIADAPCRWSVPLLARTRPARVP